MARIWAMNGYILARSLLNLILVSVKMRRLLISYYQYLLLS
jgi:hypothetical protein